MASAIFPLFPELVERAILSYLPSNEVATTIRLVSRAAREQLRQHTVVRLSQSVPHWAFTAHWTCPRACASLTREQRERLLCLTASTGDLDNLEVAVAAAGLVLTSVVIGSAAAAGQLPACEWLLERGCPTDHATQGVASFKSLLELAAGGNQRAACEWLLAHGDPWDPNAVCSALRGGDADLAEWLLSIRPEAASAPPLSGFLVSAAVGCELAVLQRLVDQAGGLAGQEWFKGRILSAAAGSRTPDWQDKVTWLLADPQRCVPDPDTCEEAAGCPDALPRLAWLAEQGFPIGKEAFNEVARQGHTPAAEWLLARGVQPGPWPPMHAARGGHVAMLRALRAAGVAMVPFTAMMSGAEVGDLAVAAWLEEEFGLEALRLDADVFNQGVRSGRVEILAWLRERGCPWNAERAWELAAGRGNGAVLEWLAEAGCPMPESGQPYVAAAHNGDLLTMAALQRLGLPWGPPGVAFASAVSPTAFDPFARHYAPLPALQWLLAAGCPVDWAAAAQATTRRRDNGREAIAAWIAEQQQAAQGSGAAAEV